MFSFWQTLVDQVELRVYKYWTVKDVSIYSHLGMNAVALQSVESTLLYLRQSMTLNVDVARAVCVFYENALHAGKIYFILHAQG